MRRMILAQLLWIGAAHGAVPVPLSGAALEQAAHNYEQHCQSCHGVNRSGGVGPALLPESLSRIKPDEIRRVIQNGRPASQMAAYSSLFSPVQIDALVDYLQQPPATPPTWNSEDIRSSHTILADVSKLPTTPQHGADPLNLFVVVEAGNHHINILDGDRFEVLARFASHFAVHGGPKFSPDGRFVYFASRDGWISLYDLHNLKLIAEVRAGLNTRNLAVSKDGRWVLVGNYLPGSLVLLDARDLSLVKTIPVIGQDGTASRVSAVYTAPPRDSFIVALKDVKEVWELSYAGKPDFEPRRIPAQDYLDDFSFSPDYRQLLATSRKAQGGQVIDLDSGKVVTDIPLPGMPHLGSGTYWKRNGQWVFATPNISKGLISVIDFKTWKLIKEIPTLGPGFFMRSHVNSRYAWTDVFFGPDNDAIHLIDKQTLEIAHTLRPMPGKTAAHVEFTHDGRYLILSIWDTDGALIVYDSNTLQEIKRIPMNKPSGKYNVGNKIEFAEGTSH
ncbi:cytochrome D1 domain-containing protein [Pseudomonas sp. RTC3]|uniref:cytochrome D1 domain-containing protein n=1 Tax=Pseudomonas sp. 5C2 TaxID=3048588 RepID=UPI002AB3CF8D|nr:cytochrome D1 domain-containing protein [Pseudomonas sp. 5C2]MDY7565236.1 cytochrome D1 domain-containing protein [Pseudomonas sp. 5C2]MEB0061707.1 cytochrome D1 domain-containing protein [Pseudomonas sp. RTC3]MEB0239616.1 cytochrome D1 domain-containing protein [Pseudomonas sp. 5C2]